MTNWDPEAFTRGLIADMREHGGKVTSGPMAGRPLLVLTTIGAKTGQPRTAIVTFTRDGDAYVVAGSKGGAPADPHWFHNLATRCQGRGTGAFRPRHRCEGEDRDQLWERHVAERSEFAEYPRSRAA